MTGFADELTKTAVAAAIGKKLLKVPGSIRRNPRKWLYGAMGALTLGSAAAASHAARKRYREGGGPRYLHAGVGPGGRVYASPAAYYNFHKHFKHDLTAEQKKRLHHRSRVALGGSAGKVKRKKD